MSRLTIAQVGLAVILAGAPAAADEPATSPDEPPAAEAPEGYDPEPPEVGPELLPPPLPNAEQLLAEYKALRALTVDEAQSLAASGQVLQAEDLEVTFVSGTFRRVVNGEGTVAGLLFLGADGPASATLTMSPPDPVDQVGMQNYLKQSPYEDGVSAAWMLASDGSLNGLLNDEGWADDPEGAAPFRDLQDKRWTFYDDPDWEHWGPALALERLDDRYGEGHVGGYLYADFRFEPGSWKTYWRDARGALYDGEHVSFFQHLLDGETPHKKRVYTSYESATLPATVDRPRTFDVVSVELEVTVPKAGGESNLAQVDLVAQIEVQALNGDLRGFPLDLQNRWRRGLGDDFVSELVVRDVRDAEGRDVAAVHDRNRLFVVLPEPLEAGEVVTLCVEYGGDLLRPTMGAEVNQYFSALRGFAWYPMARRTDRHTYAATIHTPRFYTGVTGGEMKSLDKAKEGWTTRFEESGPVLWAPLAVGEYVMVTDAFEDVTIRVFCDDSDKAYARSTIDNVKTCLAWYKTVLGKYPFDAFTIVDARSGTGPAGSTGRVDFSGDSGIWLVGIRGDISITSVAWALAYQYWGQKVVPATYKDRWIVLYGASMVGWLMVGNAIPVAERDTIVKRWHEKAIHDRVNPGATAHLLKWGRDYPLSSRGRGMLVMNMLMTQMGGNGYAGMMRTLLNTTPDGVMTRDYFQDQVRRDLGDLTDPFFAYWVDGVQVPAAEWDYEVIEQDDGQFRVEGTLTFEDGWPPNYIPLELRLSPKDVRMQAIVPSGETTHFVVKDLPSKPKKLRLDPDHIILLRERKRASGKGE